MSDNLQGDIRTGFDSNAAFDLKLDTFKTLNGVLNRPDNPYLPQTAGSGTGEQQPNYDFPKGFTFEDALLSNDPKVKDLGISFLEQKSKADPYISSGLGNEIRTPYDAAKKFINKKYGYDALVPDMEDYYYQRDWGSYSLLGKAWRLPARFLARVIVPGVLKLGEGLGYVGSLLTSVGSENYWADVADNGMSKWLEGLEQDYKDQVIPVYKQAGFNDKGFFSKLVDASFWTDEIADGVAFLASAAIPGMGMAKLGKIGALVTEVGEMGEATASATNWFGKAFSSANRFGRLATKVGLGSPAELTSFTFNTAMESAMEGAGVFKDAVAKMKDLRKRGVGEYANLNDEDIRSRAGDLAANTIGANFAILSLSNAWENKLFFKRGHIAGLPEYERAGEYLTLGEQFKVTSKALENLGKKNPFLSALSRTRVYGKKALEGFVAEGLWEENAQLVIQRMNSLDDKGNYIYGDKSLLGFAKNFIKQTGRAFIGKDKEAAENIGLGTLIGIGGGVGFSKFAGERKSLVEEIKKAISYADVARGRLFSTNDIYQTDDKGEIVYRNNKPVIDDTKLMAKKKALDAMFGNVKIANSDDFYKSKEAEYLSLTSLANYVRSLQHIGIAHIGDRIKGISGSTAALFGIDPATPSDKVGKYATFAKKFEKISQNVNEIKHAAMPNASPALQTINSVAARQRIYESLSANEVLNEMKATTEGKLLESLNKNRTINNSSISEFPVEQVNKLMYMRELNKEVMDAPDFSSLPEGVQEYHKNRDTDLTTQIEDFKKNTDLTDTKQNSKGYYTALKPDGTNVEMSQDERRMLGESASYDNAIHQHEYIAQKLSDKNEWFNWLSKLFMTKTQKDTITKAEAAEKSMKESPFYKYKEKEEGDFAKVIRLVARIVSGEKLTSAEDLALEHNYTDLILELMPEYEKALEGNRKAVINDKLNAIKTLRDNIYKKIAEKNKQVDELSDSVNGEGGLVEQLRDAIAKNKTLLVKKFQKLIYGVQTAIDEAQKEVANLEDQVNEYSGDISDLEQMLQEQDIPSMRAAINDLKEHKTWLEIEIGDVKGALDRIAKLIKDLIKIAKNLIPGFSMSKLEKIFEPSENYYAEGNVKAYEGSDTLSSYNEIKLKEGEQKELQDKLGELEKEFNLVSDTLKRLESVAQEIAKNTLNEVQKKYADLVKKKVVKKSFSQDEISANAPLAAAVPKTSSIKSKPPKEEDELFDDTFVRPLTTKFFTSTFTNVQTSGKFSPAEYAHFELLDLLTNNRRRADAIKKIGKGKLYIIAVTKHNIDKLGLKSVLYNKKEADGSTTDQTEYYEDADQAKAAIALVHILDEGGKKYYIDKDLNKIAEVSDTKTDKSNIVYTLLRASEFKDWETDEYRSMFSDEKKWEDARNKAVKAGNDLRNIIIQKSKTFDIKSPNTVFGFNVTKGIENRATDAKGEYIQNPATSSIMTEDEIDPYSIVITTDTGNGEVTINGERITVPIGRPFIKTKGPLQKLHYANNNKLDENTANTVMRVLYEISASYMKVFNEAMAGSLKGRNFVDLSESEKIKLLKKFNQQAKKPLPIEYIQYLNSVVHFDIVRAGESISPNMIYLSGSKIYFGDEAIDISNPEDFLTSTELKNFLTDVSHNVKYIQDKSKAAQQFTEYYMDGNELKSRKWTTYNHYLLSAKYPDGKARTYIPVTTSVKTDAQLSVDNGPYPPVPYKSQAIILAVPYTQGVSKNVTRASTKVQSKVKKSPKKTAAAASSLAEKFRKNQNVEIEEEVTDDMEEEDEEVPIQKSPGAAGSLADKFRKNSKNAKEEVEKEIAEKEAEDAMEQDDDDQAKTIREQGKLGEFEDEEEIYRVRITPSGMFKTEEDLNKIIEYVGKVIPQFPVQRLKNAIQTMDGREAFGQFTGSMIKIWEGAEQGSLYHEVFEAVANRLLKDYEWNAIEKEFKRRKGNYTDRESQQTISYKNATSQQVKEQLAEEFRDYKLNGKLPSDNNTRTFFQMILDFIRKYILNRPTIDDIFKGIDNGKFKNRQVRSKSRFASNYRIKFPIEEARYFDFLHGFTAFMFQDIFQSGGDTLINIDETGEMDNIIYDRVKTKISAFYSNRLSKLDATYPTNTTNKEINEQHAEMKALFKRSVDEWEKIKGDWQNFVKNHKLYLRKFGMKFDTEFDLDETEEDTDNKNRNDYTGNNFKISQKNTAAASTRLLIATLLKAKMNKVEFSATSIIPKPKAHNNNVFLYELMNYDRMMTIVIDKLAGLNRMSLVKEKLKQVSGLKDLENMNETQRQEAISNFDFEDTALSLLYSRLFEDNPLVSDETKLNLRIKFLNYVSKQNPTPWIYTVFQGSPELVIASKRGTIETFLNRINSSIRRNNKDVFIRRQIGGSNFYVSRFGNLRFIIPILQTFKANFGSVEVNNNVLTFDYPGENYKDLKEILKEYGNVKTNASGDVVKFTVKISPREEDKIDINEFITSAPGKTSKMQKLLKFLGLDEKVVTPDTLKELYRTNTPLFEKLVDVLFNIRGAMENNMFVGEISIRNANIFGYVSRLIDVLDELNPQTDKQMSHLNGDNQMVQDYVPNSFVSRIIYEMNNSSSLDELHKNFPNLAHPFAEDSIVIDRMFGQGPIKSAISMGYMEGIRNSDGKFVKASRLEEHQRLGLSFLLSLDGKYVSLPADSETEWIFNFGEFVDFTTNMQDRTDYIETIYLPKLKSEISTALAFDNYKDLVNLNIKDDGRERGKSLRFFRKMLSKSTVDKINKGIDNDVDAEKIILQNQKAIVEDIQKYISKVAEKSFDNLVENRIFNKRIDANENISYEINLPNNLAEKFGDSFTKSQAINLVAYQTINFQIGMMEQFKLFFGDVVQYKDWTKRAKGLFSPIEQTFFDDTATDTHVGDVNEWFNENKNKAFVEDAAGRTEVAIPVNDMFNTRFRNSLTARTIDDFVTVNPELVNLLNSIGSKFAKKFEETNETDGQSAATLMAIRQLMIKSGWRWTKANEEFFQYDMALARQELSKVENGNKYSYTSAALENLDKKIIEKYKNNPPTNGVSPIKTSMPSVLEDGTVSVVKHSIYPISYQLAKDFKLLDLYLDMLNGSERYDIMNFASTQKVGLRTDKEGNITSYYKNENGNINPFERTDLQAVNNTYEISLRTVGIQTETQSDEKTVTFGTQMAKDILINLMPNGIPSAFRDENQSMTEQELFDEWGSLTPEERDRYEDYRKVKDYISSLEDLKEKTVIDKLSSMGVSLKVGEDGKITYYPRDINKLKDFILDEMTRLEIDTNTIEGMQLSKDLEYFKNPSETLPSYETVSNIIWAAADKSINHMKVNGGAYIQVSSAFFNKDDRKAAYVDENGKWVTVNTKEEYDKAVADGKKMVLTSSELKFYTLSVDGKTVEGMEVYLPNFFKKKVNNKRIERGLAPLSDEQLLKYLEANPKLLEGLGFRIPTQAKSSMEFFKIKGFLPESFGKSIVVPSDITTKAGSDFDVDKLNVYLNNWKLNSQGYPEYLEYDTDESSKGIAKRYSAFVRENANRDDFNYLMTLARYSNNEKEIRTRLSTIKSQVISAINIEMNNAIEANKDIYRQMLRDINDSLSDKAPIEEQMKEYFKSGGELFSSLSPETKDIFFDLKDILAANEKNGPIEIYEYKKLAELLISQSENPIEKFILGQMTFIYNEELALLNYQKEAGDRLINEAKENLKNSNISVKDFYRARKQDALQNSSALDETEQELFEFKLDLMKDIANLSNLTSYDDFARLPLSLQNSQKALQNRYFETSRSILSTGNMFEQLLSPNNMDNIKSGKKEVYNALGKSNETETFDNFLDMGYINTKRQAFAKGKYDIGIFAIGMTNYANSQIAGIGIGETITQRGDYMEIMDLNNNDISVPFSEVKTININGSKFIPLGNGKNEDDQYIMDLISGYINGAVDVAKEPVIVEMGMHTELASSYILLTRAGVSQDKLALFMYQPAIREYLKELIFLKNQEFSASPYPFISTMRKAMLEKYSPSKPSYKDIKFSKQELADMITKGEKVKRGEAEWTDAELEKQYIALVNFLKIKMFADDLGKNYRASNHDTAKVRSIWSLVHKDIVQDDLLSGNSIVSVKDGDVKDGITAFREDTFIQKTLDLYMVFNDVFSDINLFALQQENPKMTLVDIAKRIYNDNKFISQDDFISQMKEYQAGLIDTVLNRYITDKFGYTPSDFIRKFHKEDTEDNIFAQFEKVKGIMKGVGNFILDNLEVVDNEDLGINVLSVKNRITSSDILSKELFTSAWRALLSHEDENVKRFAETMIYSSIIQFGVRAQRLNLVPLIPIEKYFEITMPSMAKLPSYDFTTFEESMIRQNAHKEGFVKDYPVRFLEFLSSDGRVESFPKERSKVSGPLPIDKRMLIKKLSDKEIEAGKKEYYNRPIFAFAGYEDQTGEVPEPARYISITMIKPFTIDSNGNVIRFVKEVFDEFDGTSRYELTNEVKARKKRKDYKSWKYTQVYKLVGADGNTPAIFKKRTTKGGENKGKVGVSYLYKPVNLFGSNIVNEIPQLKKDAANNIIADQSALNVHIPITETADSKLYEIATQMKGNIGYKDMATPKDYRSAELQTTPIQAVEMDMNKIPTMELSANLSIKIATGEKTSLVTSEKVSKGLNIPKGETRLRIIGGNIYMVTNKGMMSIAEAGGLKQVLKTEGLTAEEMSKSKMMNDWVKGAINLNVYSIEPLKIAPPNLPAIEPEC